MDAISDVSRGSDIFSSVPIFPPHPKPLNIDDLFGFNEAARKHLLEEIVEDEYFTSNKVFINQVDSFVGKRIVSLLSENKLPIETHIGNIDDNEQIGSTKALSADAAKQYNLHGNKKTNLLIADKIPIMTLKYSIDDYGKGSTEERCLQDISKLTVAEYYDMMELDTFEGRNAFIKEKLGKCRNKSYEVNSPKNKSDPLTIHQDISNLTNTRDIEYDIFGTLKNENLQQFDGVTIIKQTTMNDPEYLKQIFTCGVIIYCVNENLDQTFEATWVFNNIISFIDEVKTTCSPIFVLVSTFMTWALTKPLSLNEELPLIESDYKKRVPHPNYQLLYDLEEQIVKAQLEKKIKSTIIVSGLPYGHEENELRYLFDKAYFYKNVPIYSYDITLIPIVHVENLAQVVKQTIKHVDHTTTPFVFAKDPVQNTMLDISMAITVSLGTGICEIQCKEFAFMDAMVSQEVFDKVSSNVFLESCYPIFREEEILWKYESGFSENIDHIVKEFIDAEQTKPLRLIFYNVSVDDQLKNVVQNVSKYYHIPLISPQHVIFEYLDKILKKQEMIKEQKVLKETQKGHALRSFKQPMDLVLCEDEKSIDYEVELTKKWKIGTSSTDEASLPQMSDKDNVLARILKMKPYSYHGYMLEEYPQNLNQANILFSENSEETVSGNSMARIHIIPDLVICYDKQQISKKQTLEEHSIPLDEEQWPPRSEKPNLRLSAGSKHLEELSITADAVHSSRVVVRTNGDENSTPRKNYKGSSKSPSEIIHPMAPLFLNLSEKCPVVTIEFTDLDSEDDILYKTLCEIQRCCFPSEKEAIVPSSIIEHFFGIPTISKKENSVDKNSPRSKSQVIAENNVIDELKEAEEITLAIRSYPLMCYLINFIFPTLTDGIFKVALQTPQDAIDFLAEYIFKNNPLGHMIPRKEINIDEQLKQNKKLNFPHIDSKACFS